MFLRDLLLVTPRAFRDVLEAPTEDQVDMGSTIVADENARPRDRYQISGVDGAISRENSSKEFSQVGRRSVLQRQQGAGKAMKVRECRVWVE